ncbi:probable RNA methyltransferase CG11342 [Galendromus occidentalis]|uniref:RNA methyltransferase n=1 Tax=Galendromus occidentalis TaxID=34638 RepID=A0AAJ6QPE5_9ACAR|nr:probable RNA methyltransferase CG11342 [Galendromus occidentalis]
MIGAARIEDNIPPCDETIELISHGAGTSRFGNFHNYYEFNPISKRLKLLTPDWVLPLSDRKSLRALDIGCNSGELTVELHSHLKLLGKPLTTLGFDIDPALIKKAREWTSSDEVEDIKFETIDVMRDEDRDRVNGFAMHFDVAFCFAVTMWIHLNYGDDGLKMFLKYVASKCDFLVIEPQTWKCYRNASRRMRKEKKAFFQDIDELCWKNDILEKIDEFLQEDCDMRVERKFGITPWGRPITMYRTRIPKIEMTK